MRIVRRCGLSGAHGRHEVLVVEGECVGVGVAGVGHGRVRLQGGSTQARQLLRSAAAGLSDRYPGRVGGPALAQCCKIATQAGCSLVAKTVGVPMLAGAHVTDLLIQIDGTHLAQPLGN